MSKMATTWTTFEISLNQIGLEISQSVWNMHASETVTIEMNIFFI